MSVRRQTQEIRTYRLAWSPSNRFLATARHLRSTISNSPPRRLTRLLVYFDCFTGACVMLFGCCVHVIAQTAIERCAVLWCCAALCRTVLCCHCVFVVRVFSVQHSPVTDEPAPPMSVADYVKLKGGNKPITKILIANNGIAAVKAIRSIRKVRCVSV